MATVEIAAPARGRDYPKRGVFTITKVIDFAEAATAKGSALAAADVIEAITFDAGVVALGATLEVLEANVGGSSDVALDVGIGGGAGFVDGFDYDAAAVGDFAAVVATAAAYMGADTVDLTIQAATTAPTGGKVAVTAYFIDLNSIGDKEATEVVRDQLA